MNAPVANPPVQPKVIRRCILDNGREFIEGFRCDADPAAANEAARDFAAGLDFMRSPSVSKIGDTEWQVRYWGLD